jgi:kynurenine formamidase
VLTEVYLGLPLIHHLDLEDLSEKVAARGDSSFLFTVAPLKIRGGTGSPVNPIAVT